jgi:hypothetical protein
MSGRWSEDDHTLLVAMRKERATWAKIGLAVGRTAEGCRVYYNRQVDLGMIKADGSKPIPIDTPATAKIPANTIARALQAFQAAGIPIRQQRDVTFIDNKPMTPGKIVMEAVKSGLLPRRPMA